MKRRSLLFLIGLIALLVLVVTVLSRYASSTPDPNPNPSPRLESHLFVPYVADGDTLTVVFPDHHEESVRIVGIDTPEVPHPQKKGECYGAEATTRTKGLVLKKYVDLTRKPDENRDKYGRLLRYVTVDGVDLGALLLREGFAESLCKAFPHPRCAEYEALAAQAREAGRGMWTKCF